MRTPLHRLYLHVTSYNLGPKLFLAHFTVALVATLTFVFVSVAMPSLFGNLLAGLAATVAAVGASLFVTGRIVGPIRHVLAATRRISAGSYDERVPVAEDDELGALSESFNAMAAALEEDERSRREFISDVSHELNTPLSTLQGYVEGLLDGVVEPTEETWGLMYAETERMRRLVDDLRQLSSAEAGRLVLDIAPVPTEEPVRLATEAMRPLFAEKGVRLRVEVSEALPEVLADADRVVQVLANLLSNALRHTPAGGLVVVGAGAHGKGVLFRVSDTGAGISAEHLPRVFERFYRVEKSRSREGGGSGVGLAICRALVEAMGGSITAQSAGPGKGSTFSFVLPAANLDGTLISS
jgi:two-component system sensor histidine kinase BaeS